MFHTATLKQYAYYYNYYNNCKEINRTLLTCFLEKKINEIINDY